MADWEGLDVDDSDLQLLVRPSTLIVPPKRHKTTVTTISSTALSVPCDLPSLEPCSQLPGLSLTNRPSNRHAFPVSSTVSTGDLENLQQHSELEQHSVSAEEPRVSEDKRNRATRRIPGPAGAVQSAMSKETRRPSNDSGVEVQCTKADYLSQIGEDDEDFRHNPWLCALDFVQKSNVESDCALQSPISSINIHRRTDRVPQVVGIINSCTPNGLGDLIVTLKDPTGTIGASIHHKVLADSRFGRDVAIGSVLILQQVVVFSPNHSAQYLNITPSNVVKVISKDSCPLPKQIPPSFVTRCATSRRDDPVKLRPAQVVNAARTPEKASCSVSQGANDNNNHNSDGSRGGLQDVGVANGNMRRNAMDDAVVTEKAITNLSNLRSEGCGGHPAAAAASEKLVKRPNCETGAVKRVIIPSISLANWTDEQIDELFATCEDMQL